MASDESEYMRRMADALRSGAKMLAEQCPVCNNPLFEIKGQIWCLKCNRRVIKVSSEEEVEEALTAVTLTEIIKTITAKIEEIDIMLRRATDLSEVKKLTETMTSLLNALESAAKLRNYFTKEEKGD